jgi:hypothetical protein
LHHWQRFAGKVSAAARSQETTLARATNFQTSGEVLVALEALAGSALTVEAFSQENAFLCFDDI